MEEFHSFDVDIWQECHALECMGYPANPSPVDGSDSFPRYYSTEEVAKSEALWWLNRRIYTPATEELIARRMAERR